MSAVFSFGDPGINPNQSGQGLDWTQFIASNEALVANTFLANQAITSPRPSTVTIAPNGSLIASGGGATSPALTAGGGTSWISLLSNPLILILLLLFAVFIFRR